MPKEVELLVLGIPHRSLFLVEGKSKVGHDRFRPRQSLATAARLPKRKTGANDGPRVK